MKTYSKNQQKVPVNTNNLRQCKNYTYRILSRNIEEKETPQNNGNEMEMEWKIIKTQAIIKDPFFV